MTPLARLGRLLRSAGYRFITITPESHERVNARPGNERARSLRDVFGWSRPFDRDLIPREMLELLEEADGISADGRSKVRFSTAGDLLFVHSAFPTTAADSVFFGPDTYRYLDLLRRLRPSARRAVDVGCGTGAGGILIAGQCERVVLADINRKALEFAAVNAEINGVRNVEIVESDVLRGVGDPIDLVVSNPPYLIDDDARIYRDGRGAFGEGLSIEIVRQSHDRLGPGGRLILYTASAIVEGRDTFREALPPLPDFSYEELDPDVFGSELSRPAYGAADRLAVVALDMQKSGRNDVPRRSQ